jgi:hypothetical protein
MVDAERRGLSWSDQARFEGGSRVTGLREKIAGFAFTLLISGSLAAAPQSISVATGGDAPKIDGDTSEWVDGWTTVHIIPAVAGDKDNDTGEIDVQINARVVGDQFYMAARWPDPEESRDYQPWEKKGSKYKRDRKERDDMFAVRFHLGGEYDACMVSRTNYDVDVWLWSAGRSDVVSRADDMSHKISLDIIENAAEAKHADGHTVYIKKSYDDGERGYDRTDKPEKGSGDRLPGIHAAKAPSGGVADVEAKGVWSGGEWHLEMKRVLKTGAADDVDLSSVARLLGAIAVFNEGYSDHKSVSEELLFEFSGR